MRRVHACAAADALSASEHSAVSALAIATRRKPAIACAVPAAEPSAFAPRHTHAATASTEHVAKPAAAECAA